MVAEASNRLRYIRLGSITTVAGSGAAGFGGDSGPATDAQIENPNGVAIDAAGAILIADRTNDRVRRVDPDGTISTIAGGGLRLPSEENVPALESTLQFPLDVAVDHAGNIFIADAGNHAIRRVDPAGTITTVAGVAGSSGFAGDGGPATEALLNLPAGVTVGHKGELFIADMNNCCIRHVGSKGKITTVAGQGGLFDAGFFGDGGPATDALLSFPAAVFLDGDQNLLIADSSNGRVRSVDSDGIINTIAGGGSETPSDGAPATSVRLAAPTNIDFDRARGGIIVGDERDHRVWLAHSCRHRAAGPRLLDPRRAQAEPRPGG